MSFTAISLDKLPAPEIIAQPAFEDIFAARKARFLELVTAYDADLATEVAKALALESELVVKLLEEDSYRELTLRAAVQDAGKGNLLAFARGPILDHLAAYWGVTRLVVQEADLTASPPLEQIMETDERLRRRVQLAPEAITTAGSLGSYEFWSLTASPEVKDVHVSSPTPGDVLVTVLSTQGNGRPDEELLAQVFNTLDPRRDFTARVTLAPAVINHYSVNASLTLFDGPDSELVRLNSQEKLIAHVADRHRLGHDITIAGLHAALWGEGVQNVHLSTPVSDLVISPGHAPYCTQINVTVGGRDE